MSDPNNGEEIEVSHTGLVLGSHDLAATVDTANDDEEHIDNNKDVVQHDLDDEPTQQAQVPSTRSSLYEIQDHYSVKIPSSTLRLRSGGVVQVYEHRNKQVVLEQQQEKVIFKNVTNTALFSVYALRATYTMVALLMSGLLFVFCFQIILYLFLDLAVATGYTSSNNDHSVWKFLGTVLSLPLFVYGLASAMLLSFSFAYETWGGGQEFIKPACLALFFRKNRGRVVSEWIYFSVFVGIPSLIIAITLLAGLDNWWTISALTWFFLVFCFYLVFCCAVFYYETRACIKLGQSWNQDYDHIDNEVDTRETASTSQSWWFLLCRIILIRQVSLLSGVRSSMYHVHGTVDDDDNDMEQDGTLLEEGDNQDNKKADGRQEEDVVQGRAKRDAFRDSVGLYSCLSMCWAEKIGRCGYTTLDPPRRLYTIEEVLGTKSFVTARSWSLDKIYCIKRHRSVMVLKGPSALLPSQIQSSFVCALMANVLGLLLCIGILVWLDFETASIIILVILIVACMFPNVRNSILMYRLYKDVQSVSKSDKEAAQADEEAGNDGAMVEQLQEEQKEEDIVVPENESSQHDYDNEGIQQVWESYRVTRATNRFCWFVFVAGVVFFFVWPFLTLYAIGNYAVATVFTITALLSGFHFYMDPSIVLREVGSLEMSGNIGQQSKEREWTEKSRLSHIIGNIHQKRARNAWVIVMTFLILVFLVMCIAAINEDEDNGSIPEDTVLLEDFEYQPQPNLPYPTCKLKQGLSIPSDEDAALIDYVFLSNVAYLDPSVTQSFLDGWFGPGVAVDEQEVVAAFQETAENSDSAVTYNFITFPQATDGFGVVAIRGSVQMIDWFVDAQLWSAAALAQVVRALLPSGYTLWTPILHVLVRAASFVGQHSVDEVSHYKQTTEFVETLQESGNYSTIHVTGQSLGGGLAIITGAQTGAPAIAVSGPNALLSRKTFDPALTQDQLNRLVLNVVPDRDPVPKVDDLANLYQRIECRAPQNSLWGCHSALRSLCEVIYTCGTETRPAICQCTDLGYPEPTPTGNRSFQEACS